MKQASLEQSPAVLGSLISLLPSVTADYVWLVRVSVCDEEHRASCVN